MFIEPYYLAEDCPQCGQKDEINKWRGARMGSSSWGHDFSCCSNKCGIAFRDNPKRIEMEIQAEVFKINCAKQNIEILKEERERLIKKQSNAKTSSCES